MNESDIIFALHSIGDHYLSNLGNSQVAALESFIKTLKHISDSQLQKDINDIFSKSLEIIKNTNLFEDALSEYMKDYSKDKIEFLFTKLGVPVPPDLKNEQFIIETFCTYIKNKLETDGQILLLSGWTNMTSSHSITIFIIKHNTEYKVIITNTGAGIQYHSPKQHNDKKLCILIKNVKDKQVIHYLIYHHLLMIMKYLGKHITGNEYEFYQGLISAFEGTYDKIINEYMTSGYNAIQYTEARLLVSDEENEYQYIEPQLSGTCTWHSIFYFIYYYYITSQVSKNPHTYINKTILNFHRYSAKLRKEQIENFINFLLMDTNHNLKTYTYFTILQAHYNNFKETFDDPQIKIIYKNEYIQIENKMKTLKKQIRMNYAPNITLIYNNPDFLLDTSVNLEINSTKKFYEMKDILPIYNATLENKYKTLESCNSVLLNYVENFHEIFKTTEIPIGKDNFLLNDLLVVSVTKFFKKWFDNIESYDEELNNLSTEELTKMFKLMFEIYSRVVFIMWFDSSYKRTELFFQFALLTFSLMYSILNKRKEIISMVDDNAYNKFINYKRFIFEQPLYLFDDNDFQKIKDQMKNISKLLPLHYNLNGQINKFFISDSQWNIFYSDQPNKHQNVHIVAVIPLSFNCVHLISHNDINVPPNISKLFDYSHYKSVFFCMMASIFYLDKHSEILKLLYRENFVEKIVGLTGTNRGPENPIFSLKYYISQRLMKAPSIIESERIFDHILADKLRQSAFELSWQDPIFKSHFQTYITKNNMNIETENDNIIKHTQNYQFFQLYDIFINKKYDYILNYSGNWEYNIIPSLTTASYAEHVTQNTEFFKKNIYHSNEMENLAQIEPYVHIKDYITNNKDTYPINIRKKLFEEIKFDNSIKNIRIDFLLWLISCKVILNKLDNEEIKLFVNELEERKIKENVKYHIYCDLLLLIINSNNHTYIKQNFNNIYFACISGKRNHVRDYLLITFLMKFDCNQISDYVPIDSNIKLLKETFGKSVEIVNASKDELNNASCKFIYDSKSYLMFPAFSLTKDIQQLYDISGVIYKEIGSDTYKVATQNIGIVDLVKENSNYKIMKNGKEYVHITCLNKFLERFVLALNKIAGGVFIWKNANEYIIELMNHDLNFTYKNDKLYFGEKRVILDNVNIGLLHRWVYGIENAFLLANDDYTDCDILLLKWDEFSYNNLADINIKKGYWTKPQDYVDNVNFKFADKYYVIKLHSVGLTINVNKKEEMEAYLHSAILFGNTEVINLILYKAKMLKCQLPYIISGDLLIQVINSPFRYYFMKLWDNNKPSYEYDERVKVYPDRYSEKNYPGWPHEYIFKKNIINDNFVESLIKRDNGTPPICTKIDNFESIITDHYKGKQQLLITQLNILLKSIDYDYTKDVNEYNYDSIKFVLNKCENLYKIIYLKSRINVMNILLNNKDNDKFDCQQLFELNNMLSDKVLYTGNRPKYMVFFELLFDNIIKKDQYELIYGFNGIISNINNVNKPKNIYEMLMGKGKTSVIGPLVTFDFLFASNLIQILLIMPGTLINQSNSIFVKYSQMLEGVIYNICTDDRVGGSCKANPNCNIEECIEFEPDDRKLLLMEGKSMQAFLLNNIENDNFNLSFKDSLIIMDEVDTLMNPLISELNFPLDKKEKPKYLEEVIDIVTKLIVQNITSEIRFKSIEESIKYIDGLLQTYVPLNSFKREWDYFINQEKEEINNIRYDLVYLLRKLKATFADVFTMYYRKDYGIGDKMRTKPIIRKNEYIAIPYSAVDTPVNGSEFSDPYLTLVLTVLSYVYRQLTKDNITELFIKYYVPSLNLFGFKDHLSNNILNYTGGNLKTQLFMGTWDFILEDLDYEKLKNNRFCISDFLLNIVLNNYIDVAKNQLNCSFVDVVNRKLCEFRTGFSGTTNILLPHIITDKDLHQESQTEQNYENCEKQDVDLKSSYQTINEFNEIIHDPNKNEIEFAVKSKIINNNVDNTGIFIQSDENLITDILNKIEKYDALIDVGALFKNYDNSEIAKLIHTKINRPVAFLTNNSIKKLYKNGQITDLSQVVIENIFIYYDQKHTLGIDMPQQLKMSGLVTIAKFNRLTDTAQGIYRLRKINRGHNVDFYIVSDIATNIKTRESLYTYLADSEELYKNGMKTRSILQNIKTNKRLIDKKLESYSEILYNPLNIIKNVNDLNKNEEKLYLSFLIKNVCDKTTKINKKLCLKLCYYLFNYKGDHTKNQIKNEEEEEEETKTKQKDIWDLMNEPPIFNDDIRIPYNNYLEHDKYDYNFGSIGKKETVIFYHHLEELVNFLKKYDIYVSQLFASRVINVFLNPYRDLSQFNLLDGVALKNNNKYLLVTYEEQYLLYDNISNGKLSVYSKYKEPSNIQELIIQLITLNLTNLENITCLILSQPNIKDIAKILAGFYEKDIPYAKIYEKQDIITTLLDDTEQMKIILNIPENMSTGVIDIIIGNFKQILTESKHKCSKFLTQSHNVTEILESINTIFNRKENINKLLMILNK